MKNWCYAKGGQFLLISGKVWDLRPLARHLNVRIDAPCWPFLLCAAPDYNRPARCDKWGLPGHRNATDSAHRIPGRSALDLEALAQRFYRPMTPEERAHPQLQRRRVDTVDRAAEAPLRRYATPNIACGSAGRSQGRGRSGRNSAVARGGGFVPSYHGLDSADKDGQLRPEGDAYEKERPNAIADLRLEGRFEPDQSVDVQGNGEPSLE